MKKVVLFLALSASTFSFAGNNEPTTPVVASNDGIAKAMGAIKSECPNANGNLSYSVEIQSVCFVSGSIRKVTFWKPTNCPPNMICPQMVEEVGYVILDCENNVIEVSCSSSTM